MPIELDSEEKLAHAAGALSDIYILATSCIAIDALEEVHNLAKAIVRRTLSSAHTTHRSPSWFIHDWERRLWEEFETGAISPCGAELAV